MIVRKKELDWLVARIGGWKFASEAHRQDAWATGGLVDRERRLEIRGGVYGE
jgi:hypothetical protein